MWGGTRRRDMRADDSDTMLVNAARGGDRGAFALLLARHRPLLLALCRRKLGDPALAEDAAQEASLQALLTLDRLRRAERFGPWLAGIGLNVCRMWLRARSRERRSWEAVREEHAADASRNGHDDLTLDAADAASAALVERVREAVAELPDGQRAAVRLFYLSGLSYAETAGELGIEVGTVRTRLHKARGTLRRHLRAVGEEEAMASTASTASTEEAGTGGERQEYACSFCGKRPAEIRRLIAGPKGVFICDECVALCNTIIAEEEAKDAKAKDAGR